MASEQTSNPERCQESLVRRQGWESCCEMLHESLERSASARPRPSEVMGVRPVLLYIRQWPSAHKKLVSRSLMAYFSRSLGESVAKFSDLVPSKGVSQVVKLCRRLRRAGMYSSLSERLQAETRRSPKGRNPQLFSFCKWYPLSSLSSSQHSRGSTARSPPVKSQRLMFVLCCGWASSLPGIAWTPMLPILSKAFQWAGELFLWESFTLRLSGEWGKERKKRK